MSRLWRNSIGVVLLGTLAVACSSADVGSDAGPDEACGDAAHTLCAKLDECMGFWIKVHYGDEATCETRVKIGCARTFSPGSNTTPAKLESCAQSGGSLSCPDLFASVHPDACLPDPGTLDNGKGCGDDAQCKSTFCAKRSSETCGVCSPVSRSGGQCVNDNCSDGFVCANGSCAKPGSLNAACDRNKPCADNLVCFKGSCIAGGEAGQKCDKNQTQYPACSLLKGVGCNPLTGVCQIVSIAKAGELCGIVGMDLKICGGGSFCKVVPNTASGTCLAPAADGQSCDLRNGPSCLLPSRCDNGVCKLSDPASCK